MASPRYGERWAPALARCRPLRRYQRFRIDAERPNAWRYRDYVIRSFNQDKPYDRFIREQIAGDEMFPGDKDALLALFLRAAPRHVVGGNQDEEITGRKT